MPVRRPEAIPHCVRPSQHEIDFLSRLKMPSSIILPMLFAALLHAGWNALIRNEKDKLQITTGIAVGAALISGVLIPFFPTPSTESWCYIIASTSVQIGYFLLLANAYRTGELGLAYPLMRGVAPFVVLVAGVVFLGERISFDGYVGIILISCGILLIGGGSARADGSVTVLRALPIAPIIGAYTLIDGVGARLSGSPAAYGLWLFLFIGIGLGTLFTATRRGKPATQELRTIVLGMIGGVSMLLSYGIALWAMTIAPLAAVSALRETSILFAVIISASLLQEGISSMKLSGAILIMFGVLAIRLA